MSSKPSGGPAFPLFNDPRERPTGMSLRDYFATNVTFGHGWPLLSDPVWMLKDAKKRYQYADAMLEARKESE
jgi:hypothetical protein